jgi:hypothetical protein
MNFEIVEPLGGESPWQAFLREKGEGLCSISLTLRSPDELKRAKAQFRELGVGVLAAGRVRGGGEWFCLDSEPVFKCLIQCGLGHAYNEQVAARVYP